MTKICIKCGREEQQEFFNITSVSRVDLEGQGYDISKVTDDTMRELAGKMADAYTESVFWIDLGILADILNIPKKKKLELEEEIPY